MTASNYRIKIIRAGLELEVEGDKDFVLEMLNRYEKPASSNLVSSNDNDSTITSDSKIKTLSVGEFIRKTGFKKDVDLVLAFGYYLEKHSGLISFAPSDINTCYYEAKMESSNTSQFIILLIRKGFLMEAKQNEKKGRKKYTLTNTGFQYVEDKIQANASNKER